MNKAAYDAKITQLERWLEALEALVLDSLHGPAREVAVKLLAFAKEMK